MMNQAITTYRPFEDERPGVIGVYINIGFHEVGLFSRTQYEDLERSNALGTRGDWD